MLVIVLLRGISVVLVLPLRISVIVLPLRISLIVLRVMPAVALLLLCGERINPIVERAPLPLQFLLLATQIVLVGLHL